MKTEYKGYKIEEIYQSADGRGNHDYFISHKTMPLGKVKMETTLKKIQEDIDRLEKKGIVMTPGNQ